MSESFLDLEGVCLMVGFWAASGYLFIIEGYILLPFFFILAVLITYTYFLRLSKKLETLK